MVPPSPLQGMSLQWNLEPLLGVMASRRLFLPLGGVAGPGAVPGLLVLHKPCSCSACGSYF